MCLTLFFFSACQWAEPPSRSLVSVEQLSRMMLKSTDIQIIDVRPNDSYSANHIPGAVNVWRNEISETQDGVRGMRLRKHELEKLMSNKGFNARDSLYLYDAKGNVDAARLWWMLKLYGYEKVALVDGGLVKWLLNEYNTRSGEEVRKPDIFALIHNGDQRLLASKEEVQFGRFDKVLDVRSDDEYSGKLIKNGAFRGGHIPGALHKDYTNFIRGDDFCFKSKEEILTILQKIDIQEDDRLCVYCHSGVRSSLSTFVLREIVGMPNVSNYDGSWIEWSEDEQLPIEQELK